MYDVPLNVLCKSCKTYGRPTQEQRADMLAYTCHKCGATSRPFSPAQPPEPSTLRRN